MLQGAPFAHQYGAGQHESFAYQQSHHPQQQMYRGQHSNSTMAHSSNNQDIGDNMVTEENRRVLQWIAELLKEDTREQALLELSKKREQVPELALILWHSFGS